jgi:hypothetical protein
MLVCNLGRYTDDDGFAVSAHRLSWMLAVVRIPSLFGAAYVYLESAYTEDRAEPMEGSIAGFPACLLLFCYCVQVVCSFGSQVGKVSDNIFTATIRDDVEVLRALLAEKGCDADVRSADMTFQTALHVAVNDSCLASAQCLLESRTNPRLPDANGETPLHMAGRSNDSRLLELLLQGEGCAFDYGNRSDTTPGIRCVFGWSGVQHSDSRL